jgi:hypothetical protein
MADHNHRNAQSETIERNRVFGIDVTTSRAYWSAFSKSPVSRVIEDQPHQTRPGQSDPAMHPIPGPQWPVGQRRSNHAGAGRRGVNRCLSRRRPAADHQHCGCQISVAARLRWRATCRAAVRRRQRAPAARLSRRDHRRRFLARAGHNARAASIPRTQCGTASAAGGSGSPRR